MSTLICSVRDWQDYIEAVESTNSPGFIASSFSQKLQVKQNIHERSGGKKNIKVKSRRFQCKISS